MTSAYDAWKTSPPEDGPEPNDSHYLAAEAELEESDWFAEEVEALTKDGLSADDAKKRVLRSDKYQEKLTDLAYEIMEWNRANDEIGDERDED